MRQMLTPRLLPNDAAAAEFACNANANLQTNRATIPVTLGRRLGYYDRRLCCDGCPSIFVIHDVHDVRQRQQWLACPFLGVVLPRFPRSSGTTTTLCCSLEKGTSHVAAKHEQLHASSLSCKLDNELIHFKLSTTRKPSNWWGEAKCRAAHPITSYHILQFSSRFISCQLLKTQNIEFDSEFDFKFSTLVNKDYMQVRGMTWALIASILIKFPDDRK